VPRSKGGPVCERTLGQPIKGHSASLAWGRDCRATSHRLIIRWMFLSILSGVLCACGLTLMIAPRPFVGPRNVIAWRFGGGVVALLFGGVLVASNAGFY